MLALAVTSPGLRRAGLADAVAASAFTATGAAFASARPPGNHHRHPGGRVLSRCPADLDRLRSARA
jgi:hypothetical protein